MSEIYVANTDAIVVLDGTVYPITKGMTTVREGHELLGAGRHAMFDPIRVEYDVPAEDANPADVRAWAKANGLDVPARGKLPVDVIDAYNHRADSAETR